MVNYSFTIIGAPSTDKHSKLQYWQLRTVLSHTYYGSSVSLPNRESTRALLPRVLYTTTILKHTVLSNCFSSCHWPVYIYYPQPTLSWTFENGLRYASIWHQGEPWTTQYTNELLKNNNKQQGANTHYMLRSLGLYHKLSFTSLNVVELP